MKKIKIKMFPGLIPALDFEGLLYEVVQDGFYVLIEYHDEEDLFHIAYRIGVLTERAK